MKNKGVQGQDNFIEGRQKGYQKMYDNVKQKFSLAHERNWRIYNLRR